MLSFVTVVKHESCDKEEPRGEKAKSGEEQMQKGYRYYRII